MIMNVDHCTTRLTVTSVLADPSVKRICPVYAPAARPARFILTSTLCAFPFTSEPLPWLRLSQLACSDVLTVADQVPVPLQLVIASDCAGGSPLPGVPAKESASGEAMRHWREALTGTITLPPSEANSNDV